MIWYLCQNVKIGIIYSGVPCVWVAGTDILDELDKIEEKYNIEGTDVHIWIYII